ncbi:MAG: sugar ABC transporter ATP-binding protein [Nocardioides sp.]|nr:sugar ABC transporter ATP-binding protein [Nocardioides sp.]
MTGAHGRTLVRVEGLTKAFGATTALGGVDLTIHAGEVVAVVGHNGSGKSTLVKLLAGFHSPDGGTVDTRTSGGSPTELRFIHQDLGLVGSLSTVENLALGTNTVRPWRRLRRSDERREARELVRRLGVDADVDAPIEMLSPAERTIVAIARALRGWDELPEVVLVLDEPTAALHGAEVDQLMDVVRRVAEHGAGVLFISHRLDEVLDVADTIVALRNGRVVGNLLRSEADYARLVELVAGHAVEELDRRDTGRGTEVLRVRGLSGGAIRLFDASVHAGEIVGLAGILGSGRDDVCAAVFGAAHRTSGAVAVHGREVAAGDIRDSIRQGVAFVPGDRHRHGAVMTMTAVENLVSVLIPGATSPWHRVRRRSELREAARWFDACGVLPAQPEMELTQFSGGNQQKIVLAKWLRTQPQLLLLEEPTQGVDVGARAAIHRLIVDAAERGAAVLVASSETKELAQLCDRVLVLADGVVVEELSGSELTENRILHASVPA